MTLDRDRKKHLRPPMRRGTLIAVVAVVIVVFIFVGVMLAVSGQSLF